MTAAVCGASATAAGPAASTRVSARADWAPPASGAATDGDRPSCASDPRGPAALGSCAGPRQPPADASRTMTQRVRTDTPTDAGRVRGESHGLPDDLRGEGPVGAPAILCAG